MGTGFDSPMEGGVRPKPGSGAEPLSKERLVTELRSLGVQRGDLLAVKVSLRSVGPIDGGAETLLDALLDVVGPDGTLVGHSFVRVYPLPLSKEDAGKISDRWTPTYAGAVNAAMVRHPAAYRSSHPVQKFVAIGKMARELMAAHTVDSFAYDVQRVMAESGGRCLKLASDEMSPGVSTTHVAIGLLGLHQRRPRAGINYRNENGEIVTFERSWSYYCPVGVNNFIPRYREAGAILSEGLVGCADSKITDMGKTLDVELKLLSEDPTFFFCDDPLCQACRLSWDFSDGSFVDYWFRRAVHFLRRRIGSILPSAAE